MADEIDYATERTQQELDSIIANRVTEMAKGYPGECDMCGEYSPRLVGGACAPCRDKYNLD